MLYHWATRARLTQNLNYVIIYSILTKNDGKVNDEFLLLKRDIVFVYYQKKKHMVIELRQETSDRTNSF